MSDPACPPSLSECLSSRLRDALDAAGGWLPFDAFMAQALYAPGLGYYSRGAGQIGLSPAGGSDFATAPELSPWFGSTLATVVRQALHQSGTGAVWEFGAGRGTLARQLLSALPDLAEYHIVELSGGLKALQAKTLAQDLHRVHWHSEWPTSIAGVVVGNEVLDAMPVKLLHRVGGAWHERGVVRHATGDWAWADRPTTLRPPVEPQAPGDYLTEIHPQAEAFIRSLAQRLVRGAAVFIDYGFPESEYYHPQRHMGTLICHQGHRSDPDPLHAVGDKDITAHVNFSAMALTAQDAGLQVLGYTTQGRFLLNAGILTQLERADWAQRAMAQKLLTEHEMGELFKVLMLGAGEPWCPTAFAVGDRCHTL